MIEEIVEDMTGSKIELSKVVNLKFLSPIAPVGDGEVSIEFASVEDNGEEVKSKGSVTDGSVVKTKFSLEFKKQK